MFFVTLKQSTTDICSVLSFWKVIPQAGFFLPTLRLHQLASALPGASLPMHTSALLNAAYLFGAHVSDDVRLQSLQDELLHCALEDLSAALVNLGRPVIVDVVQTEVLLATYLMSCNRRLECVYHLDGASALLLAERLQEAQCAHQSQPLPGASCSGNEGYPQADGTEEELARAYWAVVALDNCWSAILRRAPRLTDTMFRRQLPLQSTSSRAEMVGVTNVSQ